MPENSIHSTLRETFSPPNKEIWKQFASQEIEAKDDAEILSWNSADQIRFLAYYDATDDNRSAVLQNFRITVAQDPYFGPSKWLNVPVVTVTSEEIANGTALQHLSNGADGILFRIKGAVDVSSLLKNIDWQYCSLFFQFDEADIFLGELNSFLKKNNLTKDSLTGGFFWGNDPNVKNHDLFQVGLKNFLLIKPTTPVQEIAEAISRGVEFYEQTKMQSVEIFKSIAFSISVNSSFLETIAKIKCLRFLWFQVARTYGFDQFSAADLQLHARSESWSEEKFQPHGNMLKSTTACMASVIGGANAISILCEDENNLTMTRAARNVSNLLREESHFDKVADPLAGSFALDAMVNEFAQQAWKLFQERQAK